MMSSDEEHQDGSQDEDNDEPSQKDGRETMSLTNFLFGNVDEKGELESEFLDAVSCHVQTTSFCSITDS